MRVQLHQCPPADSPVDTLISGRTLGPSAYLHHARLQRPVRKDGWTIRPEVQPWPGGSGKEGAGHRVQELCESRGGRPGLSVLTNLMVSVDVKQH